MRSYSLSLLTLLLISGFCNAQGLASEIIEGSKLKGKQLQTIPMMMSGEKENHPKICQAMCIAEEQCGGFSLWGNFCYIMGDVDARDFEASKKSWAGVISRK